MNEEFGKIMMIGKRGLALALVLGLGILGLWAAAESASISYVDERLAAIEGFAFCYYDAFSVK